MRWARSRASARRRWRALVEERERGGPFSSLEDFAARIDPRLLNRRQLESLAGAGAFDPINPDRPAVFAAAETILAHAASAHDQRESGQRGPVRRRFGGGRRADPPAARRDAGRWRSGWRPSARPSASISPPTRSMRSGTCWRRTRCGPSPSSRRCRIAEGERARVDAWPALVEGVRWRVSAKGRRYMVASLSDRSGQFEATVFDDEPCSALETAAKAGACGLLTVELDRRAGRRGAARDRQAVPAARSRWRSARGCSSRSGLRDDAAEQIARELAAARGGNGIVRLIVPIASGGEAVVLAGRDFALDAELAARLERITGEGSVDLSAQEPPKLALVG